MSAQRFSANLLNPTDSQRHEMLKNFMIKAGREEDYENIIELLSPPPDIEKYAARFELRGLKVGIIGGGLAGLSAAFELRKLGANITIFDATDDRIGGRVYTYFFDKNKKYYGELGAIRIPISHETTWHYINKFKLNTNPFIQSNPNAFVYIHNTRVRNDSEGINIEEKIYPKYNLTERERNTPWPKLYDYAINYPIYKLPSEIREEILKILPKYSPEYSQLINMSIRQVFKMLGLSQEAINLISSVDPLTGGILYFSYAEIMQEMYPLDFDALYQVAGGNANLPLAFYKSLISKQPLEYGDISDNYLGEVVFKLGHYVNGIFKSGHNEKVILKYRTKQSPQDSLEIFDYVICAIPFSTLREIEIKPLFSNRKMEAIREFNYLDAGRALLLCNKRFWEEDKEYGRIIGGISYTDLLIQSIFYPSDHALCSNPSKCTSDEPGVLIVYNFNLDSIRMLNMSEERRFDLVKRNIEEVHGLPEGYLDTVVEDYKVLHWNTQEWFKGAVAMGLPEQKRIFSYNMLKPEYNSRIFFAGEHTTVTHAWMQGALYSGKLAANMLAYDSRLKKHE
jgi:monoamine oxidase